MRRYLKHGKRAGHPLPSRPIQQAKAAVTVYLESLRSELRPRGITITTLGLCADPVARRWFDGSGYVERKPKAAVEDREAAPQFLHATGARED